MNLQSTSVDNVSYKRPMKNMNSRSNKRTTEHDLIVDNGHNMSIKWSKKIQDDRSNISTKCPSLWITKLCKYQHKLVSYYFSNVIHDANVLSVILLGKLVCQRLGDVHIWLTVDKANQSLGDICVSRDKTSSLCRGINCLLPYLTGSQWNQVEPIGQSRLTWILQPVWHAGVI